MPFTAKEAADTMIEDVMRRRKQYGLTGEAFTFTTGDVGGLPGVIFTTKSGEPIAHYVFFVDAAHRDQAVEILSGLMAAMDRVMVIRTNGGMTLRANVWAVIAGTQSLWADWDMRHNLIHNPRFPYVVRSEDIRSIEYV